MEGTIYALHVNSLYELEMIARACFEQQLHILAKIEPSVDKKNEIINIKFGIVSKLQTYAKWCMWNDMNV